MFGSVGILFLLLNMCSVFSFTYNQSLNFPLKGTDFSKSAKTPAHRHLTVGGKMLSGEHVHTNEANPERQGFRMPRSPVLTLNISVVC